MDDQTSDYDKFHPEIVKFWGNNRIYAPNNKFINKYYDFVYTENGEYLAFYDIKDKVIVYVFNSQSISEEEMLRIIKLKTFL